MTDQPDPRTMRLARRLERRICKAVCEADDGHFKTAPYIVEAIVTDDTIKNLVAFAGRAADGDFGHRAKVEAAMILSLEDAATAKLEETA